MRSDFSFPFSELSSLAASSMSRTTQIDTGIYTPRYSTIDTPFAVLSACHDSC